MILIVGTLEGTSPRTVIGSNVHLLIKAILELVGGYGESFYFFAESDSKSKKVNISENFEFFRWRKLSIFLYSYYSILDYIVF